jgi:uncharacterized protein (DUF1800 family)
MTLDPRMAVAARTASLRNARDGEPDASRSAWRARAGTMTVARRARGIVGPLFVILGLAACSMPAAPPAMTLARAPSPPPPPDGAGSRIALPASPLTPDQQILHVLNRLGYGPRPGDLERVKRMGLTRYIEGQLDPARIDDAQIEQELATYPVLAMSAAALVRDYPRPRPEATQKGGAGEMSPKATADAFPPERRPYRITEALQAAKLTRAIGSERQLQEVMVDFWFNHFNVYAQKGAVQWMVPSYEVEAIRPHALGHFRDLLMATARHPAMLFYLDNWVSTHADFIALAGPYKGTKRGLNENYGRELMELHTLGVEGGYTQADVTEVARCFTGWSIDRPDQGGGFIFRPRTHDRGAKRVLGQIIPAGGDVADGVGVIDTLSRHPSTARFVSTKLVRRFVSDDPPPRLVDRAVVTFRDTDGDIRAVLETIFTSPEFFSIVAYRAKVKTPLEVVASAARGLGAEVDPPGGGAQPWVGGALVLARQVGKLGEPLYQARPPTGYPDQAEAWVNSGALLARMNFALALAHARLPGVRVDLSRTLSGVDRSRPAQVLDRLLQALLHGEASSATRAILVRELDSAEITRVTGDDRAPTRTDVEKLAALVLGSPEFQRR